MQLSHKNRGEPSRVNLNSVVQRALQAASNEHPNVRDMAPDFGELPEVECYPADLADAFFNLLVNAAESIAMTGREGKIRLKTRADGDWVEVRIADTGTGIPEAIRDKIFDPFFTTNIVGQSTGQGLSFAHRIVRQEHGGSLTFETEVGVGAVFTVRIPIRLNTQSD